MNSKSEANDCPSPDQERGRKTERAWVKVIGHKPPSSQQSLCLPLSYPSSILFAGKKENAERVLREQEQEHSQWEREGEVQ